MLKQSPSPGASAHGDFFGACAPHNIPAYILIVADRSQINAYFFMTITKKGYSVEQIIPYLERFSYVGIFGMILLFSFILPFSKTLVVMAGGILAAEDMGNLYLFMLVSVLGMVTADSIYFGIGNIWGEKVLSIPYFSRGDRKEKLVEAERRFMRHGWFAVFSARFTPFIRAPIFMVAGASGMSWLSFLQADILSAMVMVPLASLLGYIFAEKRSTIYAYIDQGEHILAIIIGVVLLLFILRPGKKKR